MRIVLPALVLASAAVVCAFALFSPQTRIAVPEHVFKGSVRRLMADLLKKLDTMKPVDAGALIRAAALKHKVPATLVSKAISESHHTVWFHADQLFLKGVK